jgi:hypothetical protein
VTLCGIAAQALCLIATPARAGEWRASPWLGWEAASLPDLEHNLEDFGKSARQGFLDYLHARSSDGTAGSALTRVGGNAGWGGEVTVMFSPGVGLAARAGHVAFHEGRARAIGSGDYRETYTESLAFRVGLTTLLAGLAFENAGSGRLSLRGSACAGVALATAAMTQEGSFVDPDYRIDMAWSDRGNLAGSGAALELALRVQDRISPRVSLFAEGAYLMAVVDEMKWTGNVDVYRDGVIDYRKGSVLRSTRTGGALMMDFTGLRFRGGVSFAFGGPGRGPEGDEELPAERE